MEYMFLSLEFGNNIKIVEGYKKKNIVYIKKAITMDKSVDIKNSLNLSDSINEVLIKNNIKTKKAIFIINTESVIIRKIRLPLISNKKETITMIKHELGQVISADLSRYKIIYRIIEKYEDSERKTALYAAYCLPLSIYEFYLKLGKKLNLKLVSIDISSNCLNNIFLQNIKLNNNVLCFNDVYAFVNIHYDKVMFSVIYKGINDFFMIEVAERNTDIATETTFYYGEHGIDNMYIWVEVINKCCRYYHSVNNKRINKIYLYGQINDKNGLDKLLSTILHVDVEFIYYVSNTVCDDCIINEHFTSVMALYSNKSINFMTKNDNRQIISLSIAGACVLIVFLLFFTDNSLSLHEQITVLDTYINNEKNMERNSAVEKLKSENQSLEERIKTIEEAIKSVKTENVRTENIRGVYNSLPAATRVLSFSMDKNSLNMQCISDSMDEIIDLLKELKGLDFVTKIHIPAVESNDMKYTYSIICNFKVDYEE